jgi:hypothetical protein
MAVYAFPNFPSKKALKEALSKNQTVLLEDQSFINPKNFQNFTGRTCICGPHFPAAHKWYAEIDVKDGKIVKVQ